jgi:hypothetical protein
MSDVWREADRIAWSACTVLLLSSAAHAEVTLIIELINHRLRVDD